MSLLKRLEGGGSGQQGQQPQQQPGGQPPASGDSGSRLTSLQSRRVVPPGAAVQKDTYTDLKSRVQNRLLAELDPSIDVTKTAEVRNTILELFEQVLAEENIVLSRPEKHRLFESITADILGFGPMQPLLED